MNTMIKWTIVIIFGITNILFAQDNELIIKNGEVISNGGLFIYFEIENISENDVYGAKYTSKR